MNRVLLLGLFVALAFAASASADDEPSPAPRAGLFGRIGGLFGGAQSGGNPIGNVLSGMREFFNSAGKTMSTLTALARNSFRNASDPQKVLAEWRAYFEEMLKSAQDKFGGISGGIVPPALRPALPSSPPTPGASGALPALPAP